MTYSDAAKAYAEEHHGDVVPGDWYHARDNVRAFVRAAYDAGAASSRQPVRVLTTEAELDALPVGTPIQDDAGIARHRLASGDWTDPGDAPVTSWWLAETLGPLTLLVPAAAAPAEPVCICVDYTDEECPIHGRPVPAEPVRLTDPDDPRIKDGARVRYSLDATITPGDYDVAAVRSWTARGGCVAVYLLAEAPDPDAKLRHRIVVALEEAGQDCADADAAVIIATLRAEGVLS